MAYNEFAYFYDEFNGETFGPLTEDSQRYFFCAVKQYTQLEG